MRFVIGRRIIAAGETVTDFRGEPWTFVRIATAPSLGKTGRVLVSDPRARKGEPLAERVFYPSVFDGVILGAK